MRKRWLQSALAIVLALTLCLGLAPLDGLGGVFKAATKWEDTKLLVNGDFESEDKSLSPWEVTKGDNVTAEIKVDEWASNNKTQWFHVANDTEEAKNFTLTQKISNVPAGTYHVVFEQEGDKKESGLSVQINDKDPKQLPATTGWDDWKTITTDEVELTEEGDITITISGNLAPEYWGDFDNFKLEKKAAGEATTKWENTKLLVNGDFETEDKSLSPWEVTKGDNVTAEIKVDEWASNNKTQWFHVANDTEEVKNFTITQKISNVPAGIYHVVFEQEGDKKESGLSVQINDKDPKQLPATTGWDDWKTITTDEVELTEAGDITITISGNLAPEYWGDFDNFKLEQKVPDDGSEEEDTYELTVAPSATEAKAGKNVTLTATVTKNGNPIENLKENDLRLWFWCESGDAAVSSDGSGLSLTAIVTMDEAGECKLAAGLEDTDGKRVTDVSYTTISFLPAEKAPGAVKGPIDVKYVPNLDKDFALGWDISSIVVEHNSGVKYYDYNGNELKTYADFCKFAASQGITHVRVRVWNDPWDAQGRGYGGGNNDVATAVEIAKACKEADIKLLVDFHGSDFWADPERQLTPKAWEGYSVDQKAEALAEFITESLGKIKATGVTIDMVQVGNETNNAFVGESSRANMLKLFAAGADAVRAFDPSIKILIHFTDPQKGTLSNWAEDLNKNVDYDVLATSYYPQFHGSLENLTNELKAAKVKSGKDVLVVETSYPYTNVDSDDYGDDGKGILNITGGDYNWPFNVQGQATYMREVINAANKGDSIGLFYWEPAWITVGDTTGLTGDALDAQVAKNREIWNQYGSGWAAKYAGDYDKNARDWWGSSAMDNSAFFNTTGHPLDSLYVWNAVRTGMTSGKIRVEAIAETTVTIVQGDELVMPETVQITYNTDSFNDPVKWDIDAVDTNKAGTYKVHGVVTFSQEVNDGDYAGKKTGDVTATVIVKEENLITDPDDAGLEVGDNFDIGGTGVSSIPNGEDPYEGAGSMHWWISGDAAADDGWITYKIPITLAPGNYTFESMAQGADTAVVMQILDESGENILFEGAPAELIGYAKWITPAVSFTLETTTTIKLRVLVHIQAGGWGSVDNLYLHVVTDEEKPDDSEKPGGTTTPTEDAIGTRPVDDVIKDINSGNKTVTVNMQKADGSVDTTVPQKILEELRGNDVDLVLNMGAYTWIINGKDITAKDLNDVNLEVILNTNGIPSNVISKVADGQDFKQLQLKHKGEFGFKATLRIQVDKKYAGQYGNLFYYNSKGELEFMNAGKIDANGYVNLVFTHASDYVIVFGEDMTSKYVGSADTGDVNLYLYLIALLSGLAVTGLAIRRKYAVR